MFANGGAPAAAQAACTAVPPALLRSATSVLNAISDLASKNPAGLMLSGAQLAGSVGSNPGTAAKSGRIDNELPTAIDGLK